MRANLRVNKIQCKDAAEAIDILQVLVNTGKAMPWKDDDWVQPVLPTKEELFAVFKASACKKGNC